MEWISVSDRIPEYKQFVLFCVKSDQLQIFYLGWIESGSELKSKKDEWYADSAFDWFDKEQVTHWMPLPEAPKQ